MVKMLSIAMLLVGVMGCESRPQPASVKSSRIIFADDEVPNYLVVKSEGKLTVQVDTSRMRK